MIFVVWRSIAIIVLHFSGFGRLTYVIGNSAPVARLLRRVRWHEPA